MSFEDIDRFGKKSFCYKRKGIIEVRLLIWNKTKKRKHVDTIFFIEKGNTISSWKWTSLVDSIKKSKKSSYAHLKNKSLGNL